MAFNRAVANGNTSTSHALEELMLGVQHLVKIVEDGALADLSVPSVMDFAQSFERTRQLLSLVDHQVVVECQRREAAQLLGARSTAALLADQLRISDAEAWRRVRAGNAVCRRAEVDGAPLGPVRPVLAEAQRSGDLSSEHVAVIERALSEIDRPGCQRSAVEEAERDLVAQATVLNARELRKLAASKTESVSPDGSKSAGALAADRRHLSIRGNADGSMSISGRLVPCVGASLQAILGPLAKPRPDSPDHRGPDHEDTRTHGQRMHDALGDLCARALRAGGLPDAGGVPTTLIVTIDADDLAARTGHGETSDGTLIPTEDLLHAAAEAEIIPTVLDAHGECLSLGRTRRIATRSQTYALIARDGGCSFPACSHPPEWCDRHHIRAWLDGGQTDLTNLTLLCRYHHTRFAGAGWTCRLNEQGLPEWVPPRWFDPAQKPLINHRVLRRRLEAKIRARRRQHERAA